MKTPGPMTHEQAQAAVARADASIRAHGLWNKVCGACGAVVGGRLAEYGEPTEEDLSHCACPSCGANGGEVKLRAEFVPGGDGRCERP